MLDKLLNNIK